MLLNTLQWQVLKPFVDETLTSLEKSLSLRGQADDGFQDKIGDFSFKGYAIVASTSGSITGRVLIHHYTETAITIGNRLLQKGDPNISEIHEMDDSVSNALADFANVIISPAVAKLKEEKISVSISQPYFISDTKKMDNLLEDVQEIITVPIRVDQIGRFYINYLIHSKV